MKSVKTYFFNLRKFAFFSVITLITLFVVNIISSGIFIDFFKWVYDGYFTDKAEIYSVIPLLSVTEDETYKNIREIISGFVSFDVERPVDIIAENIIAVEIENPVQKEEVVAEVKTEQPKPPRVEQTTVNPTNNSGGTLEKMGVTLKNETSYEVDINALYNEPLKLTKRTSSPQVLILHTHGSEAFLPSARSVDTNSNIVKVGREMKAVFEENGISVIHSEVMHDVPKYNSSYGRALETINQTLSEYPGINIVLDVHRDAISKDDGTPVKVSAPVNGKEAAQVMFVVGTNESGLSHDNWRENLKLAIKCQEAINGAYPKLARPINLRMERFNQNKSYGSLILEVGTHGNTLEEAILAGRYSAKAISNVINSLSTE